ncbi:MAG: putative TPR repeat methyltransferase, partial [Myxococcota bacterium]
AAYQRAVTISPKTPEIHHNIGNVLKESGQDEQAIAAFRKALALGSSHPATQHALAALTGAAAETAPRAVVRDLFDDYAERFDSHLTGELSYQTPRHLRALHGDAPISRLLDLGCGTGLSAEAFSDIASHLTGVDLSPKMLARARAKGLYAELAESDLLDFLRQAAPPYDLVIAADVFVYIGDLSTVIAAIAARLAAGGAVLFSVERHDGEGDFVLQPSERFAHTDAYIDRCAADAGLTVAARQQKQLRRDGERWIEGTLYKLQRA